MKKTVTAVVMAVVVGFSVTALAQHEGRGPGGRPDVPPDARGDHQRVGMQHGQMEGLIARIAASPEAAEKFGITEEQAKEIKEGMLDLKKKEIELRKEMELAGLEQTELMTADKVDENAILKAVEKSGDIRTEMAKLHVQGLLLVKKVMTADQIEQIRKQIQKRMQQRRIGRGEGGPDGKERDGEDMGRRRDETKRRREEWQKKREREDRGSARDRDDEEDGDDEEDMD